MDSQVIQRELHYSSFQPAFTNSTVGSFGLRTTEIAPCNALSSYVRSYISVRASSATTYSIVPDGTQGVFISPNATRLSGAIEKISEVSLKEPGEYFGIRFFPGVLRHFFDIDLSQISGQFADYTFIGSKEFDDLSSRLYELASFQEQAAVCEKYLLNRFDRRDIPRLDHALDLISKYHGDIKIELLAKEAGLSSRHLNRQFKQHIGLSTKVFASITRLQHVCGLYYQDSGNYLAVDGYFDQSHMNKDFKKYLLTSPIDFFHRLSLAVK